MDHPCAAAISLADLELRSNRNDVEGLVDKSLSLADLELRSNRNLLLALACAAPSLADLELRSNRNDEGGFPAGIAVQPQR